jgi:hypothetical protein
MNLKSSEDRKKIAAVAVFAVIAAGVVYFEYFYTGAPATPVAAPTTVSAPSAPATEVATPAVTAGTAAKPVGTASFSLDPTLHMEAMLVSEQVAYAGNGRNIFSPNSAPPVVKIPTPIANARNVAQVVAPPVQQLPQIPPIELKFFGFETSENGKRQAFLLHNDDVYLASAGDIVLRRYRIIAVDLKTIQVEDMQNKNTQTLPLLTN